MADPMHQFEIHKIVDLPDGRSRRVRPNNDAGGDIADQQW